MNRTEIVVLLLVSFLAAGVFAADEPVTSNVKIRIYGKIKGDISVDDSRTNTGTYVTWVDPENNAFQTDGTGTSTNNQKNKPNDDGKFNATARETRFGMNFSGSKVGSADVAGKIEFDFFEAASANNKASVQLRHAYSTLSWADADAQILVGQSSDIVAPLNPATLNYTVLWYCGNTGYRRAQASFSKGIAMGTGKMKVQAGIFDNLGDSTFANTTGGAAEAPTFQARLAFSFPTWAPKQTTLGVSAHNGLMRDNAVGSRRATTEAVYLDLHMPITEQLTLNGEAYRGRNMQQFLGGIGYGVTPADHEISSEGFWAALALGPWNTTSVNIGIGVDNPNANDMVVPTAGGSGGLAIAANRIQNRCIFANILFKANANLTFGIELSNWETTYMGAARAEHKAKANRIQGSAIYSFY